PAPATMDPVVPGQRFDVRLRFTHHGAADMEFPSYRLWAMNKPLLEGGVVEGLSPAASPQRTMLKRDRSIELTMPVIGTDDAALTRPYFTRPSILESRYTAGDQKSLHRPAADPAL